MWPAVSDRDSPLITGPVDHATGTLILPGSAFTAGCPTAAVRPGA
jgi:hypothetical protein